MAQANIKNPKAGIRQRFCRSTYRTNVDGGYEPFSVIKCAALRLIDMDVQLKFTAANSVVGPGGNGFWILVFDTTDIDPINIANGSVPYFPPKFCLLGKNVTWTPPTEWTPFESNLIIAPSLAETFSRDGQGTTNTISSYIRYSTKEFTMSIQGRHINEGDESSGQC